MTVKFNLGNNSYHLPVFCFKRLMLSKPVRHKDGSITLGVLTFFPDGTMTSPVGTDNLVMETALKDIRECGVTYEIE